MVQAAVPAVYRYLSDLCMTVAVDAYLVPKALIDLARSQAHGRKRTGGCQLLDGREHDDEEATNPIQPS